MSIITYDWQHTFAPRCNVHVYSIHVYDYEFQEDGLMPDGRHTHTPQGKEHKNTNKTSAKARVNDCSA